MTFVEDYSSIKRAMADGLGMSEALLHLHIGLAIFVIAALALRRRMRSPWPLLAVALLALGNELVDRLSHDSWRIANSAADLLNTLLWPTVLFLLARRGKRRPGDSKVS